MSFRQPEFIDEWLNIYREGGFSKLIKEKGFVVLVTFFLFLPYLAYSNFSSCF